MEYELLDTTKNYHGRIILEDAIHYTLPIPVHWGYRDGELVRMAGHIIELRWEGPLLVGTTDEFNEDHDLYDLAAELSYVRGRTQNDILTLESGILRAVQICPIAAIPMAVKPPLGLTPRYIVDEHRLKSIDDAMLRYAIAQKEIPQEWHDERDELVTRLNAHYNRPRETRGT